MKETKHHEIQEVSGVWQGNKERRSGRGGLSNWDVSQWRKRGRTGFLVSTKQWRFHNKSKDLRGLFLDRYLQSHDFTCGSKRQENCDIMERYGVHYWDHSRTTSIKELFLCCVCESCPRCQHKTFYWCRCFFFFIKTHQPYLWSWKADTCDSSISLEGAEDNTDEKLLVTDTQSCACIYKSDNTINGHPYLASLGTHGPLNTW